MPPTPKILVTANDTGVGKTWVSGELCRQFSRSGHSVRYHKVVETGCKDGHPLDATFVQEMNPGVECSTGSRFREPIAPLAAASAEGCQLRLQDLLESVHSDGDTNAIHILEGAGGIAVPLDPDGSDWLDFAREAKVDRIVAVIDDRLGAINQARLVASYLASSGIPFHIWLNDKGDSGNLRNSQTLEQLGLPLANHAKDLLKTRPSPKKAPLDALAKRKADGLLRELSLPNPGHTNLANNDYLGLANHPNVQEAVSQAAMEYGASASASPLITGFMPIHQKLENQVCDWHGFPSGLIWNSGFQANRALLSLLPGKGDVLLADRLIHRSLVSGALLNGAKFQRYRHLDLEHLEALLERYQGAHRTWVITESLFSMDGDVPDFQKFARLKEQYGFLAIVDEAHALGWYGETGNGLLAETGFPEFADILVGTFGKALASQGAYTLFRDSSFRETLVNFSEDFIYSTYLAPTSAAAALAAIQHIQGIATGRGDWQDASREFRAILRKTYPNVPDGDSPIVPVQAGSAEATHALYRTLLQKNIRTGFIRPPTVPPGSTRLRISLKSNLGLPSLAKEIADA